jgi:diaminopimelate decarboxylase
VLADKLDGDIVQSVEIAGPLCTPLDIVAASVDLPEAELGDYIAVLQSGAYGATASPQAFLSHPQVREILL